LRKPISICFNRIASEDIFRSFEGKNVSDELIERTHPHVMKPKLQDNDERLSQHYCAGPKANVNMAHDAFAKAMLAICSKPAERGGLLLGPIGSNDVSDFFFDTGGACTSASYSPDYMTLRRKMKEEWMPAGLDMKGFVHSHPGRLDVLTREDLMYIDRLLKANPDMSMFVAPIIIPPEFRMHAMVVFRDNPSVAVEARINFF
jgi:proteasome lid subunit RPN8/RPN11